MMSTYYLGRLAGVMAFVAYMYYLGWTGEKVWHRCSLWMKVGHTACVVLNLIAVALMLRTM